MTYSELMCLSVGTLVLWQHRVEVERKQLFIMLGHGKGLLMNSSFKLIDDSLMHKVYHLEGYEHEIRVL